jgi:flagellar L-ring protein precursor FlgH
MSRFIVLILLLMVPALMAQDARPVPIATPAPQPIVHSSSLYLMPGTPTVRADGKVVNPYMQQASYLAVTIPEPREFEVHDLVTIIVRQTATGSAEGDLSTNKDVKVSGEASAFIDLAELLETRVVPTKLSAGVPKVEVGFGKEFNGDGDYERKDEIVTRLTAQVLDVKPNGTLALEARMFMANDDEELTVTVTGYCRAEDVTADNTILSTQLHDLRVVKQHTGEIRNASKKGVLTKAMDYLFNF